MMLLKRQDLSSEKKALPRINVPIGKKKKKDFMRYKEEIIACDSERLTW